LPATIAPDPDAGPAAEFLAVRAREFPDVTRAPYLNAASVTPLPVCARRATEAYGERRQNPGAFTGDDFEPLLARCRTAAARLVGGAPGEIALLPNTSFGINLAAACLPRAAGRRVLLSDREFPANVYPWMALARREGVRVDLVPTDARGNPDEDRLLEEIGRGDVAVFSFSAIQFATGYRGDLGRLGRACRAQGTLFVVDAIQALGHAPLDVHEAAVDVLATGGHKWLCSPFGTGFTWVRGELLERMEPAVVGWTALEASADYADVLDYRFDLLPDARRLEVATQPFHDYAGMTESLRLLEEVGPARILSHVTGLLDPLVAWLREHGVEILSDLRPEKRSGILAFRPPDPVATWRALDRAGIGCVVREGAVRIAPHLYNTPADVEAVIRVLTQEEAR
jgi:cysteine desulfurase / selenocysteine lyase